MEEERQALIEEELAVKYRQQEEELRRRQEENRQFMQVLECFFSIFTYLLLLPQYIATGSLILCAVQIV